MLTQKFSGRDGKVTKLHCVQVDDKIKPIAGTEFELEAELVLLAMGFVHPVHEGMIKSLGVELDQRGNVKADTEALPDVAAEDLRRRRHAARPVAGGVGDPRRPPVRARDRQVPDGRDAACRGESIAIRRRITLEDRSRRRALSSSTGRKRCRATPHTMWNRVPGYRFTCQIARAADAAPPGESGCRATLCPLFRFPKGMGAPRPASKFNTSSALSTRTRVPLAKEHGPPLGAPRGFMAQGAFGKFRRASIYHRPSASPRRTVVLSVLADPRASREPGYEPDPQAPHSLLRFRTSR